MEGNKRGGGESTQVHMLSYQKIVKQVIRVFANWF